MGAGDLLGQGQAHAAARGLGGVEGDEQILGVGDAQAAVFNGDQQLRNRSTRQLTRTGCAPLASEASTALASRLMNICSN